MPVGFWWVELGTIALCCGYYWARARRLGTFGGRAGWACATVLVLHVLNYPWAKPAH